MRSTALAVALFLLAPAAAHAGAPFKYSHRFVATGHLVDHWTVNDPSDCGPVGDGTVTVDFTSARPTKAMVTIDPTHNGEPNNSLGSWALLAPGDAFGHITDISSRPATGTIDRVDNTTLRLPASGDCGDLDAVRKAGCGTRPLKGTRVRVNGYNRRLIQAGLENDGWSFDGNRRAACGIGSIDQFGSPPSLAGGNRRGELLITMPKPSKLRHKVVTVTRTTHKTTTNGDPGSAIYTDDYTRTVTVTFTRLH